MPKRVEMTLSVTWKDMSPEEVAPVLESVVGALRASGGAIEIPQAAERILPEATRKSLGLLGRVPDTEGDGRGRPEDPRPPAVLRGNLVAARARHRAVLEETVRCYLQNGRNAKRTARQLGVRRNTVHERLLRAEQMGLFKPEPAAP